MKATMNMQPTMHRLDVPGADLYYEVRGAGRLLPVVGQPMTSTPFGPLADLLAEHNTVVTYDPHGLGQSTLEDPSLDVTPEVQADNLAKLVVAVGGGPAYVFASSGGAVARPVQGRRWSGLMGAPAKTTPHLGPSSVRLPGGVPSDSLLNYWDNLRRRH